MTKDYKKGYIEGLRRAIRSMGSSGYMNATLDMLEEEADYLQWDKESDDNE